MIRRGSMVRVHQDPPKRRRGLSSAGRAPALQAGGQRFDPVSLHQAHVCKSSLKKRISANARRVSCGFLFFKNLEKEVKRSVNGLSAQMRRGQAITLIGTGCDCIQRVSNSIFIEREELKRTARYCHIENLAGKRLQGYRIK